MEYVHARLRTRYTLYQTANSKGYDTEVIDEVMESGNKFHSVIVPSAKDLKLG